MSDPKMLAPFPWTIHDSRVQQRVYIEHDGLFPTICTLEYFDFNRDIVLARAQAIVDLVNQLQEQE